MTAKETERLTRVEEQLRILTDNHVQVSKDVRSIKETLDELTGGKKALIRLTTWAIAISTVAVALYNALKDRQ